MIKKLLEESQSQIDYFFKQVDVSRFEQIANLCASCKGLIVFTGIGKSGIIAEKIAMTLASTGTKALYLPTLNFLHGDIGLLSAGDLVFMLSKSGDAQELLNLIPFIHRKNATVISLTSKSSSKLAKYADIHMELPLEKELCQFDLAPTTSSQIQLIFGDILAIALMKIKNVKLEEYAENHPSGSIGKKATLLVKDLMLLGEKIPSCRPEDKLIDVLFELTQKKCGTLLITDQEGVLHGIFTDGDLRRSLQKHGSDVLHQEIKHLMTPSAISISANSLVLDAVKEMQRDANKWVMVTPVVEENKVVGLLRMHDIIQAGIS